MIALLIFLVIDLPDANSIGTLDDDQSFIDAKAEPAAGFWLELVGAAGAHGRRALARRWRADAARAKAPDGRPAQSAEARQAREPSVANGDARRRARGTR